MNKDRILENKKQYREENREKILRKVTCDCGAIVANNNLAIHKRSKRHQQYLELQERKNSNKLWQITYYDEAVTKEFEGNPPINKYYFEDTTIPQGAPGSNQ